MRRSNDGFEDRDAIGHGRFPVPRPCLRRRPKPTIQDWKRRLEYNHRGGQETKVNQWKIVVLSGCNRGRNLRCRAYAYHAIPRIRFSFQVEGVE
jgi:hypothetical protein